MTSTPELSKGVAYSELTRLVEASDPDLIARWEAAREAYNAAEPAWRERAAAFQRDRGIPRRRVPSPHGRALAVAAAAVAEALEELLVASEVTYGGYRDGELGDDPTPIPLELLGHRRPRGSKVTIRGTVFHDVRLFRASDLASTEHTPA